MSAHGPELWATSQLPTVAFGEQRKCHSPVPEVGGDAFDAKRHRSRGRDVARPHSRSCGNVIKRKIPWERG